MHMELRIWVATWKAFFVYSLLLSDRCTVTLVCVFVWDLESMCEDRCYRPIRAHGHSAMGLSFTWHMERWRKSRLRRRRGVWSDEENLGQPHSTYTSANQEVTEKKMWCYLKPQQMHSSKNLKRLWIHIKTKYLNSYWNCYRVDTFRGKPQITGCHWLLNMYPSTPPNH